jgi:hypothetical protein
MVTISSSERAETRCELAAKSLILSESLLFSAMSSSYLSEDRPEREGDMGGGEVEFFEEAAAPGAEGRLLIWSRM